MIQASAQRLRMQRHSAGSPDDGASARNSVASSGYEPFGRHGTEESSLGNGRQSIPELNARFGQVMARLRGGRR